jgi:hypothetical protein
VAGRQYLTYSAASRSGCLVLRVLGREACAGRPYAAIDRPLCRSWRCSDTSGVTLQHNLAAVGRPRAADPHADHRLLLPHPLGNAGYARPTGGSAGSAWRARCRTNSTFSKNRHGRFRESELLPHVFETVLRRKVSSAVTACGRRQPDQGRRQPSEGRRGRVWPTARRGGAPRGPRVY